jgi:alkanesulfonate monooxygenase SsuD/methylene tetrahydromethanopterin reductase-like flavin-dependent oxidoreductase (luciferase family)
VIAANGPRGMRLAAKHGAGWATTGTAVDSQSGWWKGLAEIRQRFDHELARAERDPQSVDRYLNLDAAPLDSLSSVEAFTEAAARAAELGFTDIVVR